MLADDPAGEADKGPAGETFRPSGSTQQGCTEFPGQGGDVVAKDKGEDRSGPHPRSRAGPALGRGKNTQGGVPLDVPAARVKEAIRRATAQLHGVGGDLLFGDGYRTRG
eukprot:6082150-Heterocapsa_arctica.AAC.1